MFHKMVYQRLFLICTVALLVSVSIIQAQTPQVIDLNFRTLTGLGLTEQFVFLMNEDGEIYKVEPDSPITALNQPIYTMANAEDFIFDPFQLFDNPVGPFEAGESLDMVLGDYLGARGSGTYTIDGDMATIDLSFDRLMPNGVYSMWCSTLHRPPDFEVIDKPCGAEDGSEANFTADAHGELEIQMTFPALDMPTETTVSVIAIAWHSDGQTYGEHTGDFGIVTFVPLRALLIPPSD